MYRYLHFNIQKQTTVSVWSDGDSICLIQGLFDTLDFYLNDHDSMLSLLEINYLAILRMQMNLKQGQLFVYVHKISLSIRILQLIRKLRSNRVFNPSHHHVTFTLLL